MLQVIFDPRFAEHDTGPGHPERAARLGALVEGLEAGGCMPASFIAPQIALIDDIAAVHDSRYVGLVEEVCRSLAGGRLAELPTGDTVVSKASYDVALLAAGAAIEAVRRAQANSPTFALARPPGHHATPTRGMGFCVFNNIAVASQWARRNLGGVLIVDFDYHHGNGTQAWVARELDSGGGGPLGYISTHAFPAYPGTGAFDERRMLAHGFIVDIPLPHATLTDDFIGVWYALLPPLARRLRASTIAVSAGFDFLAGDPIAGLPVAPRAVDALCNLLATAASETGARLALILEGGYLLENLRASGESLARNLNNVAAGLVPADLAVGLVPTESAASNIQDPGLRRMTQEILAWIRA